MADVRIALEDLKEEPEVLAVAVAKRGHKWPVVVGSAVTLAVAAGGAWLLFNSRNVSAPPPITQVTFDGRLAMNPTVSADGKYVAYASDRAGQENLDIWVQALPTGEPRQFTKDEANEDYPSFSPDGTKIAFRSDRDGGGVYVMSILGGEPHLLARNPGRPLYSPDGKHVLCSPVNGRGVSKAVIVPAEGGEPRNVKGADQFVFPIWSPDANRILAVEYSEPAHPATTWFVLPLAGGPAIPSYERTDGPAAGTPLAWLLDNHILFTAHSGDAVDLWLARVSPDGSTTADPFRWLTSAAGHISSASVGGKGTVVFSNTTAPTRIWSLPKPKEGQRSEGDLLAFPSSGSLDYFPFVSDSDKMAYLSHKSGKWDLWIRDLRTSRETWLASVEGTNPYSVSTAIKPDGSSVAYSGCRFDFTCDVFQVAATGGLPARICDHCGQVRAWSSDGTALASNVIAARDSATQEATFIQRVDPNTEKRPSSLRSLVWTCSPPISHRTDAGSRFRRPRPTSAMRACNYSLPL
jgi:Tol biopolymer transport system component